MNWISLLKTGFVLWIAVFIVGLVFSGVLGIGLLSTSFPEMSLVSILMYVVQILVLGYLARIAVRFK